MAKKKRSEVERENDLLTISSLYLAGKNQQEIAKQLGLSQPQISYDLKELQKRWSVSATSNIDEKRAQELAKVDNLERVYWREYDKSQRPFKSVSEESGRIIKDDKAITEMLPIRKRIRIEKRVGDPRYLEGVRWCIEKRSKILGLDAPVKVAPTDPTGTKEYEGGITDEERAIRTIAILDAARARRARQLGTSEVASLDTD